MTVPNYSYNVGKKLFPYSLRFLASEGNRDAWTCTFVNLGISFLPETAIYFH